MTPKELTPEQLDAIRERCDRAQGKYGGPVSVSAEPVRVEGIVSVVDVFLEFWSQEDWDFMAHSPSDIPALLAHIKFLEDHVERLHMQALNEGRRV